jgi:hypothetical protein
LRTAERRGERRDVGRRRGARALRVRKESTESLFSSTLSSLLPLPVTACCLFHFLSFDSREKDEVLLRFRRKETDLCTYCFATSLALFRSPAPDLLPANRLAQLPKLLLLRCVLSVPRFLDLAEWHEVFSPVSLQLSALHSKWRWGREQKRRTKFPSLPPPGQQRRKRRSRRLRPC